MRLRSKRMLTWMQPKVMTGEALSNPKLMERGCQFGYFKSCESPISHVRSEVLATPRGEAL